MNSIPIWMQTAGLLALSNVFMTFAWYGHLKNLTSKPWWIAALISWGIALFEYLLQVPANRIGAEQFSLAQLKIMQEVITLVVFVPFAVMYMNQPMKLDFCGRACVYWVRFTSFFVVSSTRDATLGAKLTTAREWPVLPRGLLEGNHPFVAVDTVRAQSQHQVSQQCSLDLHAATHRPPNFDNHEIVVERIY